ncbi:MAG: hypothetical protein Tsb0034_21990 [Ekhidna sp.]
MKKAILTVALTLSISLCFSPDNQTSIRDLDFLLGKWEVREDNEDKSWWEESTRQVSYTLDSTYIRIEASAISSSGKERTYLWLIHFNPKDQQFEMISMFSNWHKIQFDILKWDKKKRTLTITSGGDPGSEEYHERYGVITFQADYNSYVWKGQNKYGDPENPGIWVYTETGARLKD